MTTRATDRGALHMDGLRFALLWAVSFAAIAASSCDPFGGPGTGPPPSASLPPCVWSQTVRVVDGDTIVVSLAGSEDRVRYTGIDAPEVTGAGGGMEPFGPEATAANRTLVEDRRVCLESDITDRDRYGRLLRYVWLEDGTLVNEALLAAGMARVSTFPPDVKYVESRYLPAQRDAREAGRGIWSGKGGNW